MHRLDHVAVQVADLDRAIDFYTNTLGLKFMFRELDEEHHEAFAYVELEGGNLELLQMLDEQNQPTSHALKVEEASSLFPSAPKPVEPYCPHVALGVDDLDAMLATLTKANILLLKGPLIIPDKVRWCYMADPDNNVIEFVQWL
jgi:catechol 2,3-dioxygenase-like lactoylglutathione lyase family enzyme